MYNLDPTKFREIEHTADIGIVAEGASLEEVFANAAFGMLSLVYQGLPRQGQSRQRIELEEASLPDLLVRWLSEINYLLTVHHFLPVHILQLQIKEQNQNYHLQAVMNGADSKQQEKELHAEIKAVTYHQLQLKQNEQGFTAWIIFDI